MAYTLNDAGASVVLVNAEFLPLLTQIRGELRTVRRFVLIADDAAELPEDFEGEYEALLGACPAHFDFPDLDENARATTFYTTGTTGNPKGSISVIANWCCTLAVTAALAMAPSQGTLSSRRRLYADDADVPRPCLGRPLCRNHDGVKRVYPGRYLPDHLLKLKTTERSPSRTVCRPS